MALIASNAAGTVFIGTVTLGAVHTAAGQMLAAMPVGLALARRLPDAARTRKAPHALKSSPCAPRRPALPATPPGTDPAP